MGKRIQNMDHKEQEGELVLGNPEAAEKPVGNERVGEQATAQTVERKERCQFSDRGFGLCGDCALFPACRRGGIGLDLRRQEEVQHTAHDAQPGVPGEQAPVGRTNVHPPRALRKQGKARGQGAESATCIQHQAVPGQSPSAPAV